MCPDRAVIAHHLTKEYQLGDSHVLAVDDVSVSLSRGEIVTLRGPSGCGKTTLLQLLAGIDKPTAGSVVIEGVDITDLSDSDLTRLRRRHLGFVFQFFNLLPTMSAWENVALPGLLDGNSLRSKRARALELLDYVGIPERADHIPSQLSGGEMQRVAVARALILDPAIIFADEPTGNLDSASTDKVLGVLRQVADDHRVGILMATHDPAVDSYADRTLGMLDGRLLEASGS